MSVFCELGRQTRPVTACSGETSWAIHSRHLADGRYTTRAFAGLVARASKLTIVEAENIVEIGEIKPMDIDLPGIYVDRIVPATVEKKIELLTVRDESEPEDQGAQSDSSASSTSTTASQKSAAYERRIKIAKRAAREVRDFVREYEQGLIE